MNDSDRIDKIIHLLIAEALDIEKRSLLDFVGALNSVQMSISSRVIKIMESKRAEERKEHEKQ